MQIRLHATRILALLFCFFLMSNALFIAPSSAASSSDVQLSVKQRTREDIMRKWQQYKPMSMDYMLKSPDEIYESEPSRYGASYAIGKVKPVYVEDGINAVNFVRYLAGLPDDVVADWTLADQQQAASFINEENGELSHNPDHPEGMSDTLFDLGVKGISSSNLAYGPPTFYSSVLAYMSDSDHDNIDRVSHRRWILNPLMKKTMFGMIYNKEFYEYNPFSKVPSLNLYSSIYPFFYQYSLMYSMFYPYSSMYVFNEDRPKGSVSYDTISWPSAGDFPVEMFTADDAWSISVNPDRYDAFRTSDIQVQITRVRDSQVWNLNKSNSDLEGAYFHVETGGYGVPFCIIFRPDNVKSILPEDQFSIKVSGLYTKDGKPAQLEYKTTFFNLSMQSNMWDGDYRLHPGETFRIPFLGAIVGDITQAAAFLVDDESIAEVSSDGVIKAKRQGSTSVLVYIKDFFVNIYELKIQVNEPDQLDAISSWAEAYYQKLKQQGLIFSDYDYNYKQAMDRYGFATMAVRMAEYLQAKAMNAPKAPFKDISDNDVYVMKAYGAGIMKGTGLDQFSPDKSITRQEAAVLLFNLYKLMNGQDDGQRQTSAVSPRFSDDQKIASWAKDSVYRVNQLGLMEGDQNQFDPTGELTREQAYVIIAKLMKLLGH
ncbi:S-layer protein [Paenibacillus albiflavus]|uniref:S-layer protein n=1 Tax=Paenibacillus albiflavus TaxID=2545760 RepID=A0A4R4EF47_9BACL|nr:S-layer homology domain-containing protein [Paenibacillus albiflavus]TCZ78167.1 S-layer protein [Paenibacillus albiflavus]